LRDASVFHIAKKLLLRMPTRPVRLIDRHSILMYNLADLNKRTIPEQPVDVPAPITSSEGNPWAYAVSFAVGAGVVFLLFFWRERSLRSRMQAEYERRPPSAVPPRRARRGKRGSGKDESGRGTSAPSPRTSKANEPVAMFCYQFG
jgi:hypothetical protein